MSQAESITPPSTRAETRMVEALDEILHERHRQLDYGHSIERDLAMDEGALLRVGERYLNYTREDVTLRVGGPKYHETAVRHAAQAAAMLMAFIETQLELIDRAKREETEDYAPF
jgi:hypothetical protein